MMATDSTPSHGYTIANLYVRINAYCMRTHVNLIKCHLTRVSAEFVDGIIIHVQDESKPVMVISINIPSKHFIVTYIYV